MTTRLAVLTALLTPMVALAAASGGNPTRPAPNPLPSPGPGFSLHETEHFLVYYDDHLHWVRQRAALLESAHDHFYSAMAQAKWKIEPLREKLVCVLFFEKASFTTYARETDGMQRTWPGGYYSSRTNRIAFYNDMTSPALARYGTHINRLQAMALALQQRLAAIPRPSRHGALKRELDGLQRKLEKHRRKQLGAAERSNASKTTHEAVHQIAFNCGLQNRGIVYPFWLTEGLATHFETHVPSRPFGPSSANTPRSRTLARLRDRGGLMPLERLITLVEPAQHDPGIVAEHYAQAWGLFHVLFQQRNAALRDYFERRHAAEPGLAGKATLRRDFVDTLGEPHRLQKIWNRFLARLKTGA